MSPFPQVAFHSDRNGSRTASYWDLPSVGTTDILHPQHCPPYSASPGVGEGILPVHTVQQGS